MDLLIQLYIESKGRMFPSKGSIRTGGLSHSSKNPSSSLSPSSSSYNEDLDKAIALSLQDAEAHNEMTQKLRFDSDMAIALALQEEESKSPNNQIKQNNQNNRNNEKVSSSPSSQLSSSSSLSLFGLEIPKCNICAGCNKTILFGSSIRAINKVFHIECFNCQGCQKSISNSYVPKDGWPYHKECAITLFNPRCSCCDQAIKGIYTRHGFFESELYCAESCNNNNIPSCFSCNRKERLGKSDKYHKFPDRRCICPDCIRTAIFDSAEAKPLYDECVNFMQYVLKLPIPPEMRSIPILAVDLTALQDNSQNGVVRHNTGTVRGLTLSTKAEISHYSGSSIYFANGNIVHQNRPIHRIEEKRDVTAILVLYGLPATLTASILAHEATHAWLKLNKRFPFSLPAKTEEGLCQVISEKYLSHLLEAQGISYFQIKLINVINIFRQH